MNQYYSAKTWLKSSELFSIVENRTSLPGYKEPGKRFFTSFMRSDLPILPSHYTTEFTQVLVDGVFKSKNGRQALDSAFNEYIQHPTLGIFHAMLIFEWMGTKQNRSTACSVSFMHTGKSGFFGIKFYPAVPNPETPTDLKEAPAILDLFEELGFGRHSIDDLLFERNDTKPYFLHGQDVIKLPMSEIPRNVVDCMFKAVERLGTGRSFGGNWLFKTPLDDGEIDPVSSKKLIDRLTSERPFADKYEIEIGYRINGVEDYEIIRAFCTSKDYLTHPIAEFKYGSRKGMLCVQVWQLGYRFGIYTKSPLPEEDFAKIEATLGVKFDRFPGQ